MRSPDLRRVELSVDTGFFVPDFMTILMSPVSGVNLTCWSQQSPSSHGGIFTIPDSQIIVRSMKLIGTSPIVECFTSIKQLESGLN